MNCLYNVDLGEDNLGKELGLSERVSYLGAEQRVEDRTFTPSKFQNPRNMKL